MKKVIFLEATKVANLNSGLGQFCFHLGNELVELNKNIGFYLPKSKFGTFGKKIAYLACYKLHKFTKIWHRPIDVWHSVHQDSPYLPISKATKVLLTIHDLNFLERTDYSKAKKNRKLQNLQKKIDNADAITCISKYVALQIEEHFVIGQKKLHIIYNGNCIDENLIPTKPKSIDFEMKFMFSIGIVQPKKNFHIVLPILIENKNLHFVIAGQEKGNYKTEIIEKAKSLGCDQRVHFTGIISDSEKKWLYKHCQSFVFPSLAEGFGLPLVEAMSLGKPIFCSKLTSLPEIGGDVVNYFENFEPKEIMNCYRKGMENFNENQKIAIIERSKIFTWSNAAKKYLKLYESL